MESAPLCNHSGRVHVECALCALTLEGCMWSAHSVHSLWKGACGERTLCTHSGRVHVKCKQYALILEGCMWSAHPMHSLWKGTCKQYDLVGSHLYFINLEKCYFCITTSKLNWLLYNEKLLVNLTILCHVLALARSCLCQEPSLPAHCLLQPLSPDTSLLFGISGLL